MRLEELLKSLPENIILTDGEEDWTPDRLLSNLESTELSENVYWNGMSIRRGVSNGYIDPVPMYIRHEENQLKNGLHTSL